MLALAALLASAIGIVMGLLGGGGSILTVPMLTYVIHVDPREAIASSLFIVGATSLVGVVAHARAGRVAWRVGALFGVAGMIGAYAGGRLARYVPAPILLGAFAVLMLLTSAAMLRGRRGATTAEPHDVAVGRATALGVAVGAVSGLIGAGGGFLVVPALSLLGGLPVPRAIGTSLLVIALQSISGFAGHVSHVSLHAPMLASVTLACIAGSLVGARLAGHLQPATLARAFGWLVLAMGVFLLGKQLPESRHRDLGLGLAVALVALAAVVSMRRAHAPVPPPPTQPSTGDP